MTKEKKEDVVKKTWYVVLSTDGGYEFVRRETQRGAMEWVDSLLKAVARFSLLSALNDIQSECNPHTYGKKPEDEVFPNKFTMPLVIVNLVIKEYGLKIVER